MHPAYTDFIHDLSWQEVPEAAKNMTRRCLLDLLGVAASGTQTGLSRIIKQHALGQFGAGTQPARLLFDGRTCSPAGAALAGGMTIDSVDAHDGHKLCKGHVGCGVLPATLAILEAERGEQVSEEELLTCLLVGYEIGTRAGIALHDSACDYHTSGAWVALASAAVATRILRLNHQQTREALGIAEYHGPRSQMMRCIDHPTMVKDGSGWGSMAGLSAAYLARDGFTGAPAITMDAPELAHLWQDFGETWRIREQYFKPFPVCRWAQPAVVAALQLRERHGFAPGQIRSVRIGTFHESFRLATADPATTEQAQYSLPFPVAAALVSGRLTVEEVEGAGLHNSEILELSRSIELYEVEAFNRVFPQQRLSQLSVELDNGEWLESGPVEATGDPEAPLRDNEIDTKFLLFANPVIGHARAIRLRDTVRSMGSNSSIHEFNQLVYPAGAES